MWTCSTPGSEGEAGRRLQKVTGEKGPDVFWRYGVPNGSQDYLCRQLRQRLPSGRCEAWRW